MSSARMTTMFGGLLPAGGVAGPWAQVTGWLGSTCGSWAWAIIIRIASRFIAATPSSMATSRTIPPSQAQSLMVPSPTPTSIAPAAVDHLGGPGGEAGLVRGEVDRQGGDLLGGAQAAHRLAG